MVSHGEGSPSPATEKRRLGGTGPIVNRDEAFDGRPAAAALVESHPIRFSGGRELCGPRCQGTADGILRSCPPDLCLPFVAIGRWAMSVAFFCDESPAAGKPRSAKGLAPPGIGTNLNGFLAQPVNRQDSHSPDLQFDVVNEADARR